MIYSFKFSSYTVQYKAYLNGQQYDVSHASCFNTLFHDIIDDHENELNITMSFPLTTNDKEVNGKIEMNGNNICFLNKDEIKYFVGVIKKYIDVKLGYKIIDSKLKVTLIANGYSSRIKMALQMLRVFFEFPYNACAKEVYAIKKDIIKSPLKTVNPINLIVLLSEVRLPELCHSFSSYGYIKLHTLKSLKDAMDDPTIIRINKIFDGGVSIIPLRSKIREYDSENPYAIAEGCGNSLYELFKKCMKKNKKEPK